MIFLIDIDSVLNQLSKSWSDLHHKECKVCQDYVDLSTANVWDVSTIVECRTDIYKLLRITEVYTNAAVVNNAIEGTKLIMDKGHTVYTVTSCEGIEAIAAKMSWIETHFPHIPAKNFIPLHDKYLLHGDVLIDDRIENHFHPHVRYRWLYNQPWNRTITEQQQNKLSQFNSPLVIVNDWGDIMDRVTNERYS